MLFFLLRPRRFDHRSRLLLLRRLRYPLVLARLVLVVRSFDVVVVGAIVVVVGIVGERDLEAGNGEGPDERFDHRGHGGGGRQNGGACAEGG